MKTLWERLPRGEERCFPEFFFASRSIFISKWNVYRAGLRTGRNTASAMNIPIRYIEICRQKVSLGGILKAFFWVNHFLIELNRSILVVTKGAPVGHFFVSFRLSWVLWIPPNWFLQFRIRITSGGCGHIIKRNKDISWHHESRQVIKQSQKS